MRILLNARVVWFVTLVVALALATYAFGWVAVPVVAAMWAWIRRADATVTLMASLAGGLAWGALMLLPAVTGGAVERIAEVVGQAMTVGGPALMALTIAFPALLAGSAAGVVRGVRGT